MNDQEKKTCGPLFLECLKEFEIDSPDSLKLFSAGHMVGQAEKIYLGACSAAMFRPSQEYRKWVLASAVKISSIYGLEVSVFEREEIKDEIWIHSPEAKEDIERLSYLELNSVSWYKLRGRLCGIPDYLIDCNFHLRKGYNQPCDRVG